MHHTLILFLDTSHNAAEQLPTQQNEIDTETPLSKSQSTQSRQISIDTPFQPKNYNFPKKQYSDRSRSCLSSWFDTFTWLHYDFSKDALFCVVCIKHDSIDNLRSCRNKEMAFIKDGFSNWKKATSRFREHQSSNCHRTAVDYDIVPKTCGNIKELTNEAARVTMASNRRCFVQIIKAIQYLAKQGLAMRGKIEKESNLIQLMKLMAENDKDLENWLKRSGDNYLSHDIQNEICTLMSNDVLRTILSNMGEAHFALIADEYTDISNKEQLTLCLRWVEDDLTVHEDFFGFYNIPNIQSDTIVSAIKDILIRMNLSLENCRAQCYDGASNMLGKKSGVAKQISDIQPNAYVTHCFAHSLSLSVKDVTESCKVLSDTMSTAREIVILIKYSPKRETMLREIKDNLEGDEEATSGLTTLSTTRWTVRATCFQRILENYTALLAEWNECLKGKLQTEMRGRIIGCQSQMASFDFFFGLNLGILLYRHTDNLSKTLQAKKMSAVSAYNVALLTRKVIANLRTDESFILFYKKVIKHAQDLEQISDPKLKRKRRVPASLEIGKSNPHFHETPEDNYRHIYFEAIDIVVASIEDRFEQPGFHANANIEALLLKTLTGNTVEDDMNKLSSDFSSDFDSFLLQSQLPLFKILLGDDTFNSFDDILDKVKVLPKEQFSMISEVMKIIKLLLVNPATTASGERSFSAARRLKTWLRSTMNQERFNSVAILHTHKHLTEYIDLISICNQFIALNDNRKRNFGHFSSKDL